MSPDVKRTLSGSDLYGLFRSMGFSEMTAGVHRINLTEKRPGFAITARAANGDIEGLAIAAPACYNIGPAYEVLYMDVMPGRKTINVVKELMRRLKEHAREQGVYDIRIVTHASGPVASALKAHNFTTTPWAGYWHQITQSDQKPVTLPDGLRAVPMTGAHLNQAAIMLRSHFGKTGEKLWNIDNARSHLEHHLINDVQRLNIAVIDSDMAHEETGDPFVLVGMRLAATEFRADLGGPPKEVMRGYVLTCLDEYQGQGIRTYLYHCSIERAMNVEGIFVVSHPWLLGEQKMMGRFIKTNLVEWSYAF